MTAQAKVFAPSLPHACQLQHAHRCHRCRRTVVCCKPECRGLYVAECIGYCAGTMRPREFGKLARNEASALS